MCRNIKTLFNFDPPASEDEMHEASLQFVRKLSGYTKPSSVNQLAFDDAVSEVTLIVQKLLNSLVTLAEPKDRQIEAERAHIRALKRFG